MAQYWVRVRRNIEGKITSLYSPDLRTELISSSVADISQGFRTYTHNQLSQLIYQRRDVVLPQTLSDLESYKLSDLENWEPFEISLEKKKGFFAKYLSKIGHLFNVITIFTNGVITYMALRVANNESDTHSSVTATLNIGGALLNSVLGFFTYFLSGASNALDETGHRLDNFIGNLFKKEDTLLRASVAEAPSMANPSEPSRKFITLSVIAGGTIVLNLIIVGVRQYQEVMILAEKMLDEENLSDDQKSSLYDLIKFMVVVPSIIAGSYTMAAFQASFARELILRYGKDPKSPSNDDHASVDAQLFNAADGNGLGVDGIPSTLTYQRRSQDEIDQSKTDTSSSVVQSLPSSQGSHHNKINVT